MIDAVMRESGVESLRGTFNNGVAEVQFQDEKSLFEALYKCSKWQLCLLSKVSGLVRKEKYKQRSKRLYGNLPRCFSKQQLFFFFDGLEEKYHSFFVVQFCFGLRIGEVGSLEFLENQGLVKINNTKAGRVEYLPVISCLKPVLRRLDSFKGLNHKAARDAFRRAVKRSELYYEYGKSTNGKKLSQFSPHSLRHTAINLVAEEVKDPFKWMSFSRHDKTKLLGTGAVYRFYSLDSMRVDLEKVFNPIIQKVINLY